MAEENQIQKRQIAEKVRIMDILEGSYVKQEGWNPNYILTKNNRKISRSNVFGIVISKTESENSSLIVDDGSGTISVRSFETSPNLNSFNIGDILLIIGRPREYGSEKYLLPEIIKKTDNPKWIELRKLELELIDLKNQSSVAAMPQVAPTKSEQVFESQPSQLKEMVTDVENIETDYVEDVDETKTEEKSTTTNPPEKFEKELSNSQKIYKLIKELDNGEGSEFEDIISQSNIDGAEKIINMLLEEGELFEIKPGKLKVLE